MEAQISNKIKELIKKADTTANSVAKGTGIDNANFYRMLSGERRWRISSLEKVCEFLETTIEDVIGAPLGVPIVASISALEPFTYPGNHPQEIIGIIEYKGRVKADMLLQGLYAIKVADRSMMPAFKNGTTFIIERNSADSITDEDLVVCPDSQGKAQLCRVKFTNPEIITLRGMNPAMPDWILPRTHLKLCDRVISVHF